MAKTDLVGVCDSSFQRENTQLCFADNSRVFAGSLQTIVDTKKQRGSSANLRGSSANLRGSSANLRGSSANLRGSSANLRGSSANLRGSSANLRGSSANLRGSSGNIRGFHAKSGNKPKKKRGSSAKRKVKKLKNFKGIGK